MSDPKSVFLDRNILSLGIVIEPAVQSQTINWGGQNITSDIHGYRRKPLQGDWRDEEVASLPTIISLVASGVLKLFVGREVAFEGLKANVVGKGTKGDLFKDVEIALCESPIDRSYFKSQTIDQVCDSGELIKFCETLVKINPAMIEKVPEFWDRLPANVQENFGNLDRLRSLLDALPNKRHWPDAFNLWSAECSQSDYFLTTDRRFINALTKTAQIELPVSLMTPSQLLADLGVTDREPLPFKQDEFINMMVAH